MRQLVTPLALVAGMFVFLVTPAPLVQAQRCRGPVCCAPPVTYSQPYVAPTVVVKKEVIIEREIIPVAIAVPVTVAVPVFGYSYGGPSYQQVPASYPPQATYVPQQGPPPAPPLPVGNPCDKQIAELRAYFEQQIAELRGSSRYENGNGNDNGGPPRAPRLEGRGRGDSLAINGQALAILRNNCASCHTAPKVQGSVTLFVEDGALRPSVSREKIWDATDKGRMPKAAQKDVNAALTDAEVDVLDKWRYEVSR